jgi:hypothetical protein
VGIFVGWVVEGGGVGSFLRLVSNTAATTTPTTNTKTTAAATLTRISSYFDHIKSFPITKTINTINRKIYDYFTPFHTPPSRHRTSKMDDDDNSCGKACGIGLGFAGCLAAIIKIWQCLFD